MRTPVRRPTTHSVVIKITTMNNNNKEAAMANKNNTAPTSEALVSPAISVPSMQAEKSSTPGASRETPQELTRMTLSEVLNEPCPEVQHILPGLLPSMVGAIAGPGAAGKTMMQLQIAFAFALGLPPLEGLFPPPPRPYKIALISGEETQLTLTRRLHRILDDYLENVDLDERQCMRRGFVAQLDQQMNVYPASGIDVTLVRRGVRTEMLDTLRRITAGHDLVFLETVSRLHDGDENSATSMAAVVSAAEWLAKHGPAIVLTHHASKYAALGGMSDSAAAARGSSAFVDNIRWLANLFVMSKDEASACGISDEMRKTFLRFEVTKSNHAAPTAARWLRRGEGGVLRLAANLVKPSDSKRRSKNTSTSQGVQYGF
jgi:RecA-family ATPase